MNVYGVPWIIGAKKGLPGFNQFYMVNAAQVTRKLEVTRTTTDPKTATYTTNQMYVMGISNNVGVSFWNPYSTAYPRPLTVYVQDVANMSLTNDQGLVVNGAVNLTIPGYPNGITIPSWPGTQWLNTPPNATVGPGSAPFYPVNWSFSFLNPSDYRFSTHTFDPVGSTTSSGFEVTSGPLPQLPQFGLQITNYLQAFILDGNNVIDYVQLRDPIFNGSLNQALADPFYQDETGIFYQWSTNAYPVDPAGAINQLWVSGHPSPPSPVATMPVGGAWSTASTVIPGDTTPPAEAAFFNGFFTPNFYYVGADGMGKTYINSQLSIQAPYTPSRTAFSSFLLQANDPLVHYLASDLNSQSGSWATWANKAQWKNGVFNKIDDLVSQGCPRRRPRPSADAISRGARTSRCCFIPVWIPMPIISPIKTRWSGGRTTGISRPTPIRPSAGLAVSIAARRGRRWISSPRTFSLISSNRGASQR